MVYKTPRPLLKIYTLKDIANVVGVDKTSIIRWEKDGEIPKASRDKHGWRYYDEKMAYEVIKSIGVFQKSKKKSRKKVVENGVTALLKKGNSEEIVSILLKEPIVRKKVIKQLFEDEKARKQMLLQIIEQLFLS
ncbi:MAG: DNA-binding transcriptional MerR regulator [Oceanicoccus sp.]|jgi:DNA-binding transcriptional MerR regulator